MLPVAVQRQLDFGTFRGAKTHLVHEQAVLAVGQLGIAEIQTIFQQKLPAQKISPHDGIIPWGIYGQLPLPGQGNFLVGQAVGELVAAHDQTVTCGFRRFVPQGAKDVGQQKIVRVHKPDVIALSSRQTGVACRDDTTVLLVNHADIAVLRRVLPQNLRAGILGAVVDTDDLVVGNVLRQQRI